MADATGLADEGLATLYHLISTTQNILQILGEQQGKHDAPDPATPVAIQTLQTKYLQLGGKLRTILLQTQPLMASCTDINSIERAPQALLEQRDLLRQEVSQKNEILANVVSRLHLLQATLNTLLNANEVIS
eukprot:gnl/Hemi2/16132_TR5356_c0_g1_i1.p1 gnl/Hemi2/16132_TR5356_c0_g1~~gnl/Hemi2/16132_TR5356_c0_g1_i1.p1  ORF type:complete len:145 (+),score=38.82 gnl/Hemi2/16132_TR5356_c0_g1_i1:40-435(+)